MDTGDLLERMRDPLGAPFFPQVLRALLVITWVLHIFFVTLALGSGLFTVYGFVHKGEHQLRLARTTARLTPNAVGLGIVTGIAPLLFIQTIYDPIWYASNALTGLWSVIFVFVVMGGYSLAYLFYLKGSKDGRLLWSAVASVALISFAGWIMHVLASVQLRPDEWMQWYAPNGITDTRGIEFHDFNLPRLAFLLPVQAVLGLAVVLLVYVWYTGRDADPDDAPYRAWITGLARRLGMIAAPLYAVFGVAWGLTQADRYDLALPVAVVLGLLGIGLLAYFVLQPDLAGRARLTLGVWLVVLLVVATVREVIRSSAMEDVGYRVADYPYDVNWGTVLLFTVTTVVGVSILAYLGLVLFQSGRYGGVISKKVDRFGRVATAMLGAWFGFFLLLGLYAVVVLG